MLSLNNPSNSSLGNSSQKNNINIHSSNNANCNISSSNILSNISNFNNNSGTATITTTTASANNNSSNNSGSNVNISSNSNDNENDSNNCFQEALVKFAAKMNEKRESITSNSSMHMNSSKIHSHLPPPPPYPEVTLHPVSVPQSSSPAPLQNSLLHGILTKSSGGANKEHQASSTISNVGANAVSVGNIQHRPTTFSPTLARLLTAPERNRSNRPNIASSNRNQKSTLSEILNSKVGKYSYYIIDVQI